MEQNEASRTLANRLICYFSGLFIMTAGIAMSVKSNLGVSPVSSIPYTLTRCWGIEMGKATILFHCVLVLLQILILRKSFQLKSLLQIPVGVVFGYFTTFCNYLMTFAPTPENIAVRIGMVLVSIVLVAVGIFFYLPAGEGIMQAVSHVSSIAFPKVKVGFDITMVLISLVACLIVLRSMGSVGIGTALSAVLVGVVLGQIMKLWAKHRKTRCACASRA